MSETASDDPGHLPFTIAEYQSRLAGCRRRMAQANIDVLVVTTPENINYLSGYYNVGNQAYQSLLVPASGEPHFVLRKLFFEGIEGVSWLTRGTAVADTADMVEATIAALRGLGAERGRIGYDHRGLYLPPFVLDGLREGLSEAAFVPTSGLVETGRMIKSARELDYIRHACRVSVAAMEAGIAAIRPGVTENDVAAPIYAEQIRLGSTFLSNQPYVYAGVRAPARRASFERTVIKAGDTIWFEGSASIHRYGGPIMRTFAVGPPSPEVRRVMAVMIDALNALLETARPGVAAGKVDRAARSRVEAAGLGDRWLHRTGYSVGISFPPNWGEGYIIDLKPGDPRPLAAGMVFHRVPWVLIPEIGAIGLSETWAVTEDGVEVLTQTPRELRVVL